jgi:hypothetical protein
MAKRNIFGELMEGAAAMKSHREGKITLRSYKVAADPFMWNDYVLAHGEP